MARRRAALLTLVATAALAACGAGNGTNDDAATAGGEAGAAEAAAARPDRFDEDRAWRWLRRQVALGPRPAGSPALARLAEDAAEALPNGRLEAVPGHPGLRNVIGHIPGRRPAVVVAAHHDTKDIPGFVGANDGAGGTAMVLELARALRRERRLARAPEIRFVLFDGEEATDDADFLGTGLRGSKAYARRYARSTRALVLLDFVAEKGIRIPREQYSDVGLWRRLRAAARRVGSLSAFPDEQQSGILDDHIPFVQRRIPAIDLIDFDFECWHKTCDDLDVVSRRSLDLVGEAVLELLRTWR